MKNYNKIMILFLLGILLACNDSFIDLTDPNAFTSDKFYKNEKDIDAAVVAAYTSLRSQYSQFYVFGDVASDNTYTSQLQIANDQYGVDLNNVVSTSSIVNNFWAAAYASIDRANTVLSRIDDIAMADDKRNTLKAEVKFIRALSYFNLVQIFGAVPLYSKELTSIEEAFEAGRTPVEQIYTLIEQDLKDVASILPETPIIKGRISGLAAKGLLGKVYLTKGESSLAVQILSEVVGKLNLEPVYAEIFNPDKPFNNEILFVVNFERAPGQGSAYTNDLAPNGSNISPIGSSQGFSQLEPSLVSKFQSADARKTLVDSVTVAGIKYYYSKKYLDTKMTIAGNAASDWIVLRYADILLLYADALNNTGQATQALPYLNEVRIRAGLQELSGLSKEELSLAIEKERQLEFVNEGDRWFDLLRRGRTITVLNSFYQSIGKAASVEPYELVFPLPFSQVTLKPEKLIQNEGYQ